MNGTNMKKINMNRVNSSSLFHFTQKLDTLKKIIKNGLRYSFAYEQYPSSIVQSYLFPFEDINDDLKMANGVAIPMISFCDIPITRASEHIDRYGHYMIGLNKNNFSRDFANIINPVIYVHSPNLENAITRFGIEYGKAEREILKMFTDRNIVNSFIGKTKQELLCDNNFIKIVDPLINIRFLSNFLIGLIKPIKDETYSYYDEREWRLFLPEEAKDINWIWGITKKEYKQERNSWNESLEKNEDMFIKIPWEYYDEYITHIVVSKEKEIDALIKFIMESDKIFGYDSNKDYFRMKLISKITSFERIEKDF